MKLTRYTTLYKTICTGACLILALVLGACSPEPETLADIYAAKKGSYELRTKHIDADGKPQFINRLIKQDSPYLLQHAHNPVDWWAWSDEAFASAREQDKPILLSIGYSTCHWCHVMERESFEDKEVAEFINAHFIPIKVDREEHPDIDEVYMTAVQMLSGKAGWPLTAVLTPEAQPFFGGTYIPRDQFLNLLGRIDSTWLENRDAIMEQAGRLQTALNKVSQTARSSAAINSNFLEQAAQLIMSRLAIEPPRGQAAFPREPEMLFLLNHALNSLDAEAYTAVEKRLTMLAQSGLHDFVGGGFHRYSVDSSWEVPHFEKMLYNQAQLGRTYAQAHLQSGNEGFAAIAESTFDFVLNQMQDAEGGFYSAMDAESGGREGGFYLWTFEELQSLLSIKELRLAQEFLGASRIGNFEGSNILTFALSKDTDPHDAIEGIRAKLKAARSGRQPPATDKKIITAWNASLISALLDGVRATQRDDFAAAASKAGQRLWQESFDKNTGLARIVPSGSIRIEGSLEDYAYLSNAYLDLYDHNGDKVWLERAESISQQMIERFYDEDLQAFKISSSKRQQELIVSLVTARDDAIVSGNSLAAQSLARLFRRTGNIDYRNYARGVLAKFTSQMESSPDSLSGMLVAASLLNIGEVSGMQYAAKSKVELQSTIVGNQLKVNIDIAEGWHINASTVLQDALIPTRLKGIDEHCSKLAVPSYPQGKRVKLGFQDEELSVYEGQLSIIAGIETSPELDCPLLAAEINLQACSDEVCQSPELLQIRHQTP